MRENFVFGFPITLKEKTRNRVENEIKLKTYFLNVQDILTTKLHTFGGLTLIC